MNTLVLAFLLLTGAHASDLRLRASVKASLRLGGAVNCAYKCDLIWGQRQTWGQSAKDRVRGAEYIACLEGCERCGGGKNENCQTTCKSTNWVTYTYHFDPITREFGKIENDDLIEPLTSCLSGCTSKFFPKPGQGAGKDGQLSRKYIKCTNTCYASKVEDATRLSMERCENGATAGGYSAAHCVVGVEKGVIEPDKACIMGCVQNLCQAGAKCNGGGLWKEGGSKASTGCQLITPQLNRSYAVGDPSNWYTAAESYLNVHKDRRAAESNQVGGLLGCCSAAYQRCSYVAGSNMFSKPYGVSLGRVIATSEKHCKLPGKKNKNTFGNIIQNRGEFQCNCKEFFKECGAAGFGLPNGWVCNYGDGRSCTSEADCP